MRKNDFLRLIFDIEYLFLTHIFDKEYRFLTPILDKDDPFFDKEDRNPVSINH